MPMLVGLVLAAIAIIVMTKVQTELSTRIAAFMRTYAFFSHVLQSFFLLQGVIPWRNTERNYSYTSCSLAFPASSCSSNPNSTVCFAGAVAITPAVGTAFFGSNLCSVNGSEINTAGRSSGDKNSIQV